jgi:outer membrane protein assembly factor BamE (lipoprotein component of BamABCDE complex)
MLRVAEWHTEVMGDSRRMPVSFSTAGQVKGRRIGPSTARCTNRWRLLACALASCGLAAISAGCSTTITQHGTQLSEQDVSQVSQGMSQDQVRQVLGTPATTASVGRGNAYYYISSKMAQTSFYKPQEIDRKVVAVYFTQAGQVERVANYGMKDGKVFDFNGRTTPSVNTNDQSLVQQLFRNLGQRQIFGG